MILKSLKSQGPLVNIAYLVIAVLLWLQSFMRPFAYTFFEGEYKDLLYSPIYAVTLRFPLLQVALSLTIVLFVAFLIQQISNSFSLIKVRTKLPALVFILLTGGFTPMHTLHPVYLASILLMLSIYSIFSAFNNPEPVTHFFNAGLFLSIGSLFYFNLVALLPAFFIAVSVLRREPQFRDYFALFTGFLVPWLFGFSYLFFTDRIPEAITIFGNSILTPLNHFSKNYLLLGYAGVIALLTIIGSFKMLQLYDSSKVSTRKYFQVLFILFVFSMLGFALVPAASQEMLIISFIPLAFLIANLFSSISSTFWSELLFSMLLLASAFMQVARYFAIY